MIFILEALYIRSYFLSIIIGICINKDNYHLSKRNQTKYIRKTTLRRMYVLYSLYLTIGLA